MVGRRGRTRPGGYGELTVGFHSLDGVEQEVNKGLFELVIVAGDEVGSGAVIALKGNGTALNAGLDQAQRMFQGIMQADRGKARLGRSGEFEHLADDRFDAAEFAPDDFDQFSVLIFFEEEVDESFSGDEGVANFVGHAGGEGAGAGESVELAQVLIEERATVEFIEDQSDAGVPGTVHDKGADAEAGGGGSDAWELDTAVGDGDAGAGDLADNVAQSRRKNIEGLFGNPIRLEAEHAGGGLGNGLDLIGAVDSNNPAEDTVTQRRCKTQPLVTHF